MSNNFNTLNDGIQGIFTLDPGIKNSYCARSDIDDDLTEDQLLEQLRQTIVANNEDPTNYGFICTRWDGFKRVKRKFFFGSKLIGTCGTEIHAVRKREFDREYSDHIQLLLEQSKPLCSYEDFLEYVIKSHSIFKDMNV